MLVLGLVGCSKQYSSSSVKLKQEYVETFSLAFATNADDITKVSIDLYNSALANETPKYDTFHSEYEKIDKLVPKNSSEKDFQDSIHKFANYYTMLSCDVALLKGYKDSRDDGTMGKVEYEETTKRYEISKAENLKYMKADFKNIMKYYK